MDVDLELDDDSDCMYKNHIIYHASKLRKFNIYLLIIESHIYLAINYGTFVFDLLALVSAMQVIVAISNRVNAK